MKKDNEVPVKTKKNENDTPGIFKVKKNKISDEEKNEDLGKMKIGKAHSIDNDKVSIKIKGEKK